MDYGTHLSDSERDLLGLALDRFAQDLEDGDVEQVGTGGGVLAVWARTRSSEIAWAADVVIISKDDLEAQQIKDAEARS